MDQSTAAPARRREALRRRSSHRNAVAKAAKRGAEDGTDLIVVLDKEYRLGAAGRGRATRRAVRLRGAIAAWQGDLERRALAKPAVNADQGARRDDLARAGAPEVVTLRLALTRDGRGAAMFIAHKITFGARRCTSLAVLVRDQPEPSIAALHAAVHDEIAHRVERGTRLHGHGVSRSKANGQRRGPAGP